MTRATSSATDIRGAWAGEIGQTQFMPNEYDESAVDFDGDGQRDLQQVGARRPRLRGSPRASTAGRPTNPAPGSDGA